MAYKIQPLKAERFLEIALEYMKPFEGTYIYNAVVRDFKEKTDLVDVGYGKWLKQVLEFITQRYNFKSKRILDFGCGTGELTVRMRCLGYEAFGIDIHEEHLELAKVLAEENGLDKEMFILNNLPKELPFGDASFDVVTMFSVLEHLDDSTLSWLLPELKRICSGVVYILVPNRLKPTDDHTGLRFVPWMPRWLAVNYIKLRGRKHRYFISRDTSWDVYYRSFFRIVSLFRRYGFILNFPPDEVIYPPLDKAPPITRIGKWVRVGAKRIFVGIPLPVKLMVNLGYPEQALYPYLNLIFIPQRGR
ncbi:methyltransferase domain-containing protein [Atrimonas thermophila]|uniref:class I SAM-dependent methyltransferase n=1 Tax=Atrimonas thermophila TaxID=3064161 RepID=UPI00399C8300